MNTGVHREPGMIASNPTVGAVLSPLQLRHALRAHHEHEDDSVLAERADSAYLTNEGRRSSPVRSLDFTSIGEGSRIMHFIDPRRYRAIALHGEVYQGHYQHDWRDINHIQKLRSKYPVERPHLIPEHEPFPQGRTQEEIQRNRNFTRSHGSRKLPHGLLKCGHQLLMA